MESDKSLKIVVIGAGGFIGLRLSCLISKNNNLHISPTESIPISKIILFDTSFPNEIIPKELSQDKRITFLQGDLTNKEDITKAIDPENCSNVTIIHVAAILSGYAENDFDLGMKVNLFGSINVIECVRELSRIIGMPQIYVFISTDYVACYNEQNIKNPVNEESFRLSPVSYGIQKACVELLICDYHRKGFLDGRVARISCTLGRPVFSNSISYSYTGIFTQTLSGKDFAISIPLDVPYPCSSLSANSKGILYIASKINSEKIGENRVVQLPVKSFTLNEIWEKTKEIAEKNRIKLGKIITGEKEEGNTTVKTINVCPFVDCSKAESLGFEMDVDIEKIIKEYIDLYILKKKTLYEVC